MFQDFYGLQRDPFSLSPDLGFLFLSSAHEEAIAHLVYGLEQKEEIITIIGDIGTGKTLAIHRLLDQISGSVIPVFLNVTTIGFGEMLRLALLKLGRDMEGQRSLAALVHELENELIRQRDLGRSVLLIIDEAQNLSLEQLESVRMLLNLARPGKPALQIILTGQMGLQAKLDSAELRQLRQRIRVSYTFETLNREEVKDYVLHRLRKAGREKPLFKPGALEKIYEHSAGVPRVVNFLASNALLAGYVEKASAIAAKHVEEAASESGPMLAEDLPEPVVPAALPRVEVDDHVIEPKPQDPPKSQPPRDRPPRQASKPKRSRAAWFWVALLLVAVVVAGYLTYPKWSSILDRGTPSKSVAKTESPAAPAANPATAAAERPAQLEPESTLPQQDAPMTATDGDASSQAGDPAANGGTQPESTPATQTPTIAETPHEQVEVAAEAAPQPAVAKPDSFIVHVASFKDAARARHLEEVLLARGLPAYRVDMTMSSRIWHRVYLGPIAGQEEAEKTAADLKREGVITYARVSHR